MLSTHAMEMPAFNWIVLPHVIFLVPDIIAAIAIIAAAVAVITEVVVAVIIVHTIPGEAVLVTNTTGATPGGDPIHMTCLNTGHPDDTTANHNLTKDVDPTLIARVGLYHREEDTAIVPIRSLQITSTPGMLQDLPGRNDAELIKTVYCSHQLSKPSHEANYRSSCQSC